jgi:FdhD protein
MQFLHINGVLVEPTYKYNIIKVKNGKKFTFEDTLVREVKLDIIVNGEKIASLMATPVDQEALAVGYLISENIIASVNDIEKIYLKDDDVTVEIIAKVNSEAIQRLNTEGVVISGCGRSKTANIDPKNMDALVNSCNYHISADLISKEMNGFFQYCKLYEQTGSVHTAKLYLDGGEFFIAEDIAQHSTVDKVIGKAKLAGVDTTNSALMVSGRLSSEMVAKAVMHKIPILISRTASTCLGVQIAEKFSLTLVGFARENRMNIYTHERRIDV